MEQSLHNPAHYTCGNTRRMTFYCFPYRANPTMQTMNSFHNKRKWFGVSLTRRISCLSSQRRTSGPSSDSALKTPRRAMRTAAASWSNEDSMCWIWDCASAQLWKTEIKKIKNRREEGGREGEVQVSVGVGVVWMTHTGVVTKSRNVNILSGEANIDSSCHFLDKSPYSLSLLT